MPTCHKDNPQEYYERAVLDIEQFLRKVQHLPCTLPGDCNSDRDDTRFSCLDLMSTSLVYRIFCSDRSTWHGRLSHRMLDYFFTHQPHQQKDAFIDHKLLHLEEPAKALRSDHDLVVLKVFLLQHGQTRSTRSRRHSKCRKWAVARDKLQGFDIDIEWFKHLLLDSGRYYNICRRFVHTRDHHTSTKTRPRLSSYAESDI